MKSKLKTMLSGVTASPISVGIQQNTGARIVKTGKSILCACAL